jgi:hypothetical protein
VYYSIIGILGMAIFLGMFGLSLSFFSWSAVYAHSYLRQLMYFASLTVTGSDVQAQRLQFYIDVEKLEKEFVLTSAEYLLSLANVKWTFTGTFFW